MLITSRLRSACRVSRSTRSGAADAPDLSQLSSLELASLPAAERTVDAEALSAYESVKLFIARATAMRPDFRITNENAPDVAAIVARLHGCPGHRAGGARVKLFSPEALRARLEDQLALLSAGARDLPERQQTLRGAIAWSYDLLDAGSCSSIGCRSSRAGSTWLPRPSVALARSSAWRSSTGSLRSPSRASSARSTARASRASRSSTTRRTAGAEQLEPQ